MAYENTILLYIDGMTSFRDASPRMLKLAFETFCAFALGEEPREKPENDGEEIAIKSLMQSLNRSSGKSAAQRQNAQKPRLAKSSQPEPTVSEASQTQPNLTPVPAPVPAPVPVPVPVPVPAPAPAPAPHATHENKYTPPPPRGMLVDVEVGTGHSHNSPTGEPPAPMENQTAVTGEERPKKANKAKKPQIHPTEYTEQFETFWAAYPKHESKSKAFESWEATSLIRPPLAEMLKIVATFARQPAWTKDNGQFVPMASTWLNQRRWEDVQVSATAQAGQTERPKRRETHKNGELITDPEILAFDDATWENYKKTMAEYGAYFT